MRDLQKDNDMSFLATNNGNATLMMAKLEYSEILADLFVDGRYYKPKNIIKLNTKNEIPSIMNHIM